MNTILIICRKFWISNLLLLILCPVMGQGKKVVPEDYKLWSTLENTAISDNGRWVSYAVCYESQKDTLFIKNIATDKTFTAPLAFNYRFIQDNLFAYLLPNKRFELLNLTNGKRIDFEAVSDYHVAHNALLIETHSQDNNYQLQLVDFKGKLLWSAQSVVTYKIDPTSRRMCYWTESDKSKISILQFENLENKTAAHVNPSHFYPLFKWHKNGTSLLFTDTFKNDDKSIDDKLYFYRLKDNKLFTFEPNSTRVIPDTVALDARYLNQLYISQDESTVYFTIKSNNSSFNTQDKLVEIWNTSDKELYPLRKLTGNSYNDNRLVKWTVNSNDFLILGDNVHPRMFGHVDQPSLLLYNEDENKPHFTQNPKYTFWLFNTITKEKSLFLKQLPGNGGFYNFSPHGKYFLYSKDLNWWLYSFQNNKHINLTEKYGNRFVNPSDKYISAPELCPFAGWSDDDQFLYIYDQYDIWEFSTEDAKGRVLTSGRNSEEINRFTKENVYPQNGMVSTDCMSIVPGKNCTIKTTKKDNSLQGYSYLDNQKKIKPILTAPLKLSNLKPAHSTDDYLFVQENFNTPASLQVIKAQKNKTIYQSNQHYKKYAWGSSKLINYRTKKGRVLNGVLLFPASYDPNAKYPMIVNIYEKQTYQLYNYSNPSLLNNSSINFTNFTNEGYFVLLPDIEFELGNPGFSALDCVTSAVREVVKKYPINEKKIGITGHSHGGYETDFIITQTDMFAAAAAGAAVTHFNSNYLDYWNGNFKPIAWFYEFKQLRMGKTLFEDYNGYQLNSPVTHAAKIKTPLLSYTGANDTQVSPKQSNEFYQALRRLQKEHIMLVYANENHVFISPDAQEDLSIKLKEWFDYYLKGTSKKQWMKPQ